MPLTDAEMAKIAAEAKDAAPENAPPQTPSGAPLSDAQMAAIAAPPEKMGGLEAAARTFYKHLTFGTEPGADKAKSEQAAAEHPIVNVATSIPAFVAQTAALGPLAAAGKAVEGAGLAARLARGAGSAAELALLPNTEAKTALGAIGTGAKVGGVYSGLETAGSDLTDPTKTPGDVAKDVALSGGLGTIGGGILGGAAHGAGRLVGAGLNRYVPELQTALDAAKSPEGQGARDIMRQLGYDKYSLDDLRAVRDAMNDPAQAHRFDDLNLIEALESQPATPSGPGGELKPGVRVSPNLRDYAQDVANTGGQGRQDAIDAFARRRSEMAGKIQSDIDALTASQNPAPAVEDLPKLVDQAFGSGQREADAQSIADAKTALDQRFARLRQKPLLYTNELGEVYRQSPVFQKAVADAAETDAVAKAIAAKGAPSEAGGLTAWMKGLTSAPAAEGTESAAALGNRLAGAIKGESPAEALARNASNENLSPDTQGTIARLQEDLRSATTAKDRAEIIDLINTLKGPPPPSPPPTGTPAHAIQILSPSNILDIHHQLVLAAKPKVGGDLSAEMKAGQLKNWFAGWVERQFKGYKNLNSDYSVFKSRMEAGEHGGNLSIAGGGPKDKAALQFLQKISADHQAAINDVQAKTAAYDRAMAKFQSGANKRAPAVTDLNNAMANAEGRQGVLDEFRKSLGENWKEQLARSTNTDSLIKQATTTAGQNRLNMVLGPDRGPGFIDNLLSIAAKKAATDAPLNVPANHPSVQFYGRMLAEGRQGPADAYRRAFGDKIVNALSQASGSNSAGANAIVDKLLTQAGKQHILDLWGPDQGTKLIEQLYNKQMQAGFSKTLYGGPDTAYKLARNKKMDSLMDAVHGIFHLRPLQTVKSLHEMASAGLKQRRADQANLLLSRQGPAEVAPILDSMLAGQQLQKTGNPVRNWLLRGVGGVPAAGQESLASILKNQDHRRR